MTTLKINRPINIDELRELLTLMENQVTTDRFEDTELHIDGNDAVIDVIIDEFGNVTLE